MAPLVAEVPATVAITRVDLERFLTWLGSPG